MQKEWIATTDIVGYLHVLYVVLAPNHLQELCDIQ